MAYLNTSAYFENSMLTSLLAPVTESKTTGGMLQISLDSQNILAYLSYCHFISLHYFSNILPDKQKIDVAASRRSGSRPNHRLCDFDYFNQHQTDSSSSLESHYSLHRMCLQVDQIRLFHTSRKQLR